MTKTMALIALEDIVIDEDLDFRTDKEAGIDELAASIESFGLVQPITVAPTNGDGKHHVVAGRRRLRAFVSLGRTHIEAIVDDDLTSERAQMIGQIIENLQREDVSPLDEARAYHQLGSYEMKQKDIAAAVGVSTSHVSARMALLKLPPKILESVNAGKIPMVTATRLARAPKAVRDQFADAIQVSDWQIDSAVREADHAKAQADLAKAIGEASSLPVGLAGMGHTPVDTMAERIGLTDDDKPKSHEWTITDRYHRSNYDDVESFVAAVAGAKGKGLFVTANGHYSQVVVVDSANLSKERKAEEERQRQIAEEREAAAAKRRSDFENTIAPMITTPDKARVLEYLLRQELEDNLRGWNIEPLFRLACDRLGIEHETADTQDTLELALKVHATKSTTEMIRTLLALEGDQHPSPLLEELGFYDTFPMEHVPPHTQVRLYEAGRVDRKRLTTDAEVIIANAEADAAYQEEFDQRLEARVEEILTAKMVEDGLDPDEHEDWPYSADEVDAVREQAVLDLEAQDLAAEDEEG